jgi:YHS domain-containing protein
MKELARDSLLSSEGSQDAYYRNVLVNFGFTDYQIKAIFSGVNPGINMEVRSPIEGFILSRNVSPGLRFDRGVEFFRIADLTKIWVLADIFENEASLYQPGKQVKIELPYLNRALSARVSKVLPQFDPATRTLKLRLEADNPGFILRPDMFVNVEIPISGPPAIIVSTEAVFDSGLKKTVFVDRGNGFFEPRPVETGRFLGERVEITKGLKPGEKIVISGNFLIDSEARLQMASSSILGKVSRDPVCGMNIDEDIARAKGNFWEYRGKMYFFCEAGDREAFRKDPERFLKSDQKPGIMTMSPDPIKTKNPKASENSRLSQGRGVNKSASHAMEEMKMTNPTDSKSSSQKSGVPMGVRNPGMGTMPASMPGNAPEPKGTMMAPLPAGPLPQPKEVGPIPQDPFPEMKKGDALPGMPAVPSDSKAVPSMSPPKAMEGEAPFPGSFPQGKGVYVPPAVNNAPEVQKGRQRVPVRRLPGMEKGSSNPGEGAGSQ